MTISDLREHVGKEVQLTCYLRDVSESANKFNNHWIDLMVMDITGSTTLKMWAEQLDTDIRKYIGTVITVVGQVDLFQDRAGMNVGGYKPAVPGTFQMSDFFLSVSEKEKENYLSRIQHLIGEFSDEPLKLLVSTILIAKKKLIATSYKYGGTDHHRYIGGLLAHTLEVAEDAFQNAKNMTKEYRPYKTFVDANLVLAAALLHDIGKLSTLDDGEGRLSKRGLLVPHAVESVLLVTAYNNALGDSKVPDLAPLVHTILMCDHTNDELKPKTLAAMIVRSANLASIQKDKFALAFYQEKQKKGVITDTLYSSSFGTTLIK